MIKLMIFEEEALKVERSAAKVFLQLVPDEGRVVNLSRQLKARLNTQEGDRPVAPKTPYEFLAVLDEARVQLTLADGFATSFIS